MMKKRRLLSLVLAFMMLFVLAVPAFAGDNDADEPADELVTQEILSDGDDDGTEVGPTVASLSTTIGDLEAPQGDAPKGQAMFVGSSIEIAAAAADPVVYTQIQDVDLGFHHGTSPNGGQSVTKDIGYVKKASEWFAQIGQNMWLLVTYSGDDADGNPIFTENTDYVCPICQSSTWISYSNNSDILGGKFDGKNMQVAHIAPGTVDLSGSVSFKKMKLAGPDGFIAASPFDGFLFNLFACDAAGNIPTGDDPINDVPIEVGAGGIVSFLFNEEGGYLPGWFKFVEDPASAPGWQMEEPFTNGVLFELRLIGSTLTPYWPNGDPIDGDGNDEVNNVPINGDLTISVTDKTVQNEVQYRNVEQRNVWDITQRDVWDITQRDVWDITQRDAWDITQRNAWDITQRNVWDITQRDAWDITQRDAWDITQRNVWDITQRNAWDITQRNVWDITQRDVWDITQRDVWDIYQGQTWEIFQREIQPYERPVFERFLNSFNGTLVSRLKYSGVDANAVATDGGAFNNGHTYVSIPADGTPKTILIADSSKNNGKKTPAQYNTPINPEYSYTAQVVDNKLELTFDNRLVATSVGGYLAVPKNNSSKAATATVSTSMSGATVNITIKDGGATFNGTGAFAKNGTQTVSFNGYTVALEYNGNGVKSAKITSAPEPVFNGGANEVASITDDMFPGNAPKHEVVKNGETLVFDLSNAAICDGNYYLYLHFEALSWLKSLDYSFKGWEFATQDVGEYFKVGDGSKDPVKVGDGAGSYYKVGEGYGEYVIVDEGFGEYAKVGDGYGEYAKVDEGYGAYTVVDREKVKDEMVTVSTNTKTYNYQVIDSSNAVVRSGSVTSGTAANENGLFAGAYTVRLYGNDKDETKAVVIPADGSNSVTFGEYVYTLEVKTLDDADPRRLADNKVADVQLPDNKIADVKLPDNKIADVKLPDNKIADVKLPDNKVANVYLEVEVLDPVYLEDVILPALPLCEDCDEVDPFHEHAKRIN